LGVPLGRRGLTKARTIKPSSTDRRRLAPGG
jgi:hypothetical protein